MYYGANDAKLFMGQSTAATLPDPATDTFEEVALTGTITPPPVTKGTGFFSVTNDKKRRSVGGRQQDQVIEGSLVIDWEEKTHRDMYADANAGGAVKRNWYLQYSADAGGRRLDFVGFVSNWTEESFDASADATEHRAAFTIPVDGAVTVATPEAPE